MTIWWLNERSFYKDFRTSMNKAVCRKLCTVLTSGNSFYIDRTDMKTTKNELSTYLGSLIEQLCMISFLWVTLPSDLA